MLQCADIYSYIVATAYLFLRLDKDVPRQGKLIKVNMCHVCKIRQSTIKSPTRELSLVDTGGSAMLCACGSESNLVICCHKLLQDTWATTCPWTLC